jgi:regulatory protein
MQSAKDRAFFYLSRLARTERQVRNYLSRKGYSRAEITEAISYLNEHHYLSDSSFAEGYIQSRIRKLDGLEIKQLLFQKGIDAPTADSL